MFFCHKFQTNRRPLVYTRPLPCRYSDTDPLPHVYIQDGLDDNVVKCFGDQIQVAGAWQLVICYGRRRCRRSYIGRAAKPSCIVLVVYTFGRDIIILIAGFVKIVSLL